MIQYLIILLDKQSTSFCHYENNIDSHLIPIDTLKAGIRWAMTENLMIQFVYPDYELPEQYKKAIDSIDHSDIVSSQCEATTLRDNAEVVVFHTWNTLDNFIFNQEQAYVLRTSKADLFDRYKQIKSVLKKLKRLNIVITDVETFTEADLQTYKQVLGIIAKDVEQLYIDGKSPQLNLLTDRMILTAMNNCGAGDTCITLAPNGKFYVCPAFYYKDETDCIGDLENGLDIKNQQLYKLDHAPICRHCDAYQCKRCIWLNRKTTLEVNTPSREQCIMTHLERNASRELLHNIRKHGTFMPEHEDIDEIDYLDPFDKRDEWDNQ